MPKRLSFLCLCVSLMICFSGTAAQSPATVKYRKQIKPILETYCYDCHADGANKGNVAFDQFKTDKQILETNELWSRVLKMTRAGLMPPAKKTKPTPEQREQLAQWIKRDVFAISAKDPDPGRVTVRRLNRIEYHNTIHDLLGVDFDTQSEFPPDDTGYGFDNIGDVLTLPPMLLEKYLAAATKIISKAVPASPEADKEKYEKFFPRPIPPESDGLARKEYARERLSTFATKAFRRPVEEATLDRLVELAQRVYTEGRKPFEAGVSQAMVAVLASPRFLFREESLEPAASQQKYAYVDDYALASRLSYFLWSSMPDDELFNLASQHALRKNLEPQLKRMLADSKSKAFIRNFTGQWLRGRDIENVPIESRFVLAREDGNDPAFEKARRRFVSCVTNARRS